MSRATPKLREFAERLIAHEEGQNKPTDTINSPTFLVAERLHRHLSMLIGSVGVQALLSRSLALAAEEVAWLRAVQIKADGSFEGVNELRSKVDQGAIVEGRVVLNTHMLGLLVAIIGEDLTLGLVGDVWPGMSLKNLDFGGGVGNEKTKRRE